MSRWWPLVAVCLGSFMLIVDTTVVTVALPAMAGGLRTGIAGLQWVVNGYPLVLAALAQGAGSLGDRFGTRRVFCWSVTVFGLASLASGLAPNVGLLIAARCAQGAGGAALVVTALSLLGSHYQDRDRGTAIGIWTAVLGAAGAVGPLFGGLLTQELGWRAIFFVNLPLCALTLGLTIRHIPTPTTAPTGPPRFDPLGMLTFAAGSVTLTYALIRAGAAAGGWTEPSTIALFAFAGLAAVAFVITARRAKHPLLDIRLFATMSFASAMLCVVAGAVVFADLIYLSIWLQAVLQLDPMTAGLSLTPMAATIFLASTFIGRRLSGRLPRTMLASGTLLAAVGCGLEWLTCIEDANWLSVLPGLVVIGLGIGIAGPAGSVVVLASAPPARSGMASGAMATVRQLGQTLGVAVLGVVFQAGIASSLAGQVATPAALASSIGSGQLAATPALRAAASHGLGLVYLVTAALCGFAAVLTMLAARPESSPGPSKPAPSYRERHPRC